MKLDLSRLTFIAEKLGKRSPPPLRWLAALATHASPIVREGAVYGLALHTANIYALGVLSWIAVTDPDKTVRSAAQEALEP